MPTNITAMIVDDEEDSRGVLGNLLRRYHPSVEVVGEAGNVADAFTVIGRVRPQLVFLDIQMPKASGFDLLQQFDPVPFSVIFVTSFDEYAINAIRFNALDYLLKPIELEELKNALEKAARHIEGGRDDDGRYIRLLSSLNASAPEKSVMVHTGEKVTILKAGEISSIEAAGRYCNIVTRDGSKYSTAHYLRDFELYLSSLPDFIRISKSVIINVRHIRDYTKGELCIIRMRNDQMFEVARRKKAEILEALRK